MSRILKLLAIVGCLNEHDIIQDVSKSRLDLTVKFNFKYK